MSQMLTIGFVCVTRRWVGWGATGLNTNFFFFYNILEIKTLRPKKKNVIGNCTVLFPTNEFIISFISHRAAKCNVPLNGFVTPHKLLCMLWHHIIDHHIMHLQLNSCILGIWVHAFQIYVILICTMIRLCMCVCNMHVNIV